MTIRIRITLWYMCLITLVLAILSSALYGYIFYKTNQDIKATIQNTVKGIKISQSVDFWNSLQIDVSPNIANNQVIIQVVDYIHQKVRYSRNLVEAGITLHYPDPSPELKLNYNKISVNGDPFTILDIPIVLPDRSIIGLLQVGIYTGKEVNILHNLLWILALSSIGVLALAFLLGLFVSKRALKPLHKVIMASNRIESGDDLIKRIPRGQPNDEIGLLTDTLNNMLVRLQEAYQRLNEAYDAQRRFVGDASHELRTPLTTIRGNGDLLKKLWSTITREAQRPLEQHHIDLSLEAITDISDEAERMTRLVADLLTLARGDAGIMMEKTNLAIHPLILEAARKANLLPRTVEWRVEHIDDLLPVHIQGDSDYLQQLLLILIENAFKYTSFGYVELSGLQKEGYAGIQVSDTGIGMHSNELTLIFERFYRADVSRGKTSGYGLGLSIAQWIINEHSGSIEVSSKENEGTTFVVWLPTITD
ncbi:HAMP domain-containing histidine kinase [Paenibacillus sp. MWE-103]|uniref:histidine kinase n=1 Tax=Paenibacillus artemisiicola TaxID=1172618 RepID=A0ABS3W9R7_9BACL|nr:HAMP domain-containing sensor histidine kinase [Paenibacillus artemisiicola]MBO7745081.1 HAMP domain-containing histidine kinase [Paenibacillus artemisiicola]